MGGGVNGKLAGNSKKAAGRTNGSACAFDHQIELFPTSRYEEILLIISNSTAKSMHQCEGDDRRKIHRVSYRKLRCVPLETMMENRTVGEKKSIDGNIEETHESELLNLSDEMGQRLRKKINMQLKNGNKRLNMKYEYDIKYRIKTVSKKNVSLYWNKRDNRMISKEKLWLYMKEALGWILVQKQRK